MKKNTVDSLQELTGRESGIIIYKSEGLLMNWSSFDGLPKMFADTAISLGEKIPEVEGTHCEDCTGYLAGVEIINLSSEDDPENLEITGGLVYDLGSGIIVIAPDGWC